MNLCSKICMVVSISFFVVIVCKDRDMVWTSWIKIFASNSKPFPEMQGFQVHRSHSLTIEHLGLGLGLLYCLIGLVI